MGNIKESLQEAMQLEGALGAALGDWKSGMCLGYVGSNSPAFPLDKLEVAVAGNTDVIRAKLKVAEMIQINDRIEDILISLKEQYHLLRLTQAIEGLFLYLALDRSKSNLALARLKLAEIENKLIL